MNLHIIDKTFIVTGATSGFGQGVAIKLLEDGANIIANARQKPGLDGLKTRFPQQVTIFQGDITQSDTIARLIDTIQSQQIDGVFVNAGGPPAKSFLESELEEWDETYKSVVRWKIELTKKILPIFEKQQYGRFVYLESASVKQPIENLVYSNSMRMAVVGFVKTMALEVASKGITCNVLAPGYHLTPAVNRLIHKKMELQHISLDEAKLSIEKGIPVGKMGNPDGIAELAAWLLSPASKFVTGQTYIVDGGMVKATL